MGIDVDGSGGGWCVAAVSLSIGDITVTLPAVPPAVSCCLHRHHQPDWTATLNYTEYSKTLNILTISSTFYLIETDIWGPARQNISPSTWNDWI